MTHLGTVVDLFDSIVCQVRVTVPSVPTFENGGDGAIVIQAIPACDEAALWIRGQAPASSKKSSPSPAQPLELSTRTQTYSVLPGRKTIIQTEDGPVDCGTYAVMKIAHGRAAGSAMHSGAIFEGHESYHEENGFANHHGAVCIRIGQRTSHPCSGRSYGTAKTFMPFADLWIAVSGASQYEDERCAQSGIAATIKWLEEQNNNDYTVIAHFVSGCTK